MASDNSNRRTLATPADIEACTIGSARPHNGPIHLAEYDTAWPDLFAQEATRIMQALGGAVVRLEHVGSTSVPNLAAKPIIDIVLEVHDSSNESSYVVDLVAHGYRLRIREPNWWQHRVLKGPDFETNLHVFSAGCPEVGRMIRFRDRLRSHPSDRQLYEAKKRELAARHWAYVQNYADAKSGVIDQILARAHASNAST